MSHSTFFSAGITGLTLFAFTLLVGCEAKPRAPALTDDPVFQNEQFGLRMLAPEGWKQVASAIIPPGTQTKPKQIVGYGSAQFNAAFEIFVIDVPENSDPLLAAQTPSHGVLEWKPAGKSEAMMVGDVPAMRYRFTGMQGTAAQSKEVVAVRRDGRLLLFTLIAPANDKLAGEAARRAIDSVSWRK